MKYYVLGAAWYGNESEPDQTERFIQNGIWENGYQDKLLDIVKSVNAGDMVAIKSSFATRDGRSVLRIKAIGRVVENLGDGRTLKVNWEGDFEPFDLEGFGHYRNTIQEVSAGDIHKIFDSNNNSNFYPQVSLFLEQASTDNLQVNSYLNKFQGLSVKVSFGKGNPARVPWIAFLNNVDKVQEGIYPVYLFYKEKNLLILAYGMSETYLPSRNWKITGEKTITQYFQDHSLGQPDRYGSSFVYKAYNVNSEINQSVINSDLLKLISIYKNIPIQTTSKTQLDLSFKPDSFYSLAVNAGYIVDILLCTRFSASLLTKPFLILTGLSGSGKTKLAQTFVKWMCKDNSQYRIVPVGADWTNREPLLGYPNALNSNEYVKPDSNVLDLIILANNRPELPHFLILDEMNLSHVERYFADFLSVMESKEEILLYADGEKKGDVPAKLKLPSNLFIIGTVNIDETTNMFSPKVLDRANTIEFRVTQGEMKKFLEDVKDIDMYSISGKGVNMSKSFLEMSSDNSIDIQEKDEIVSVIYQFFGKLKLVGAEFGYRNATEMLRLIQQLTILDNQLSTNQKLDIAIVQKLLPKLHGSRRKLCPVLEALGALCIPENNNIVEDVFNNTQFDVFGENVFYPLTLEKLIRMHRGAIDNGFTSFAEA